MRIVAVPAMATVIVGLHAALQKRFVIAPPPPTAAPSTPTSTTLTTTTTADIARLIPGNVHRASALSVGVGGKGQDVACTLQCLRYYHHQHQSQQQEHPSASAGTTAAATGARDIGSSRRGGSGTSDNSSNKRLQLVQFIGSGAAGDQVMELLRDMLDDDNNDSNNSNNNNSNNHDWSSTTVQTAAGLRTCTTVVATDSTTELVEPSGTVTGAERQQLYRALSSASASVSTVSGSTAPAASLCFMGSLPPGCPDDTYAQIYERLVTAAPDDSSDNKNNDSAATTTTLCLIDTVAGLRPLLRAIGRRGAATTKAILKINASELCRLVGVVATVNDDPKQQGGGIAAEAAGVSSDTIAAAVTAFLQQQQQQQQHDDGDNSPPPPQQSQHRTAPPSPLVALCLTDDKHPAYVALIDDEEKSSCDEPSSSLPSFVLHKLPIAPLFGGDKEDPTTTTTTAATKAVYSIGAGDAVAAGTLAAWTYLYRRDADCLPEVVAAALDAAAAATNAAAAASSSKSSLYLTAFAFGLACGSASCLHEENSVVALPDVVRLFAAEVTPRAALASVAPAANTAR